jgi:hypothetical protein
MFNPFEKLSYRLMEAYRKQGKSFLVSQTYPRGIDPLIDEGKTSLLFSKYGNISHANIHLSALKGDKFAALIDLEKEAHRNKIIDMMKLDSKYILFTDVVKSVEEVERRMNAKYKENIRRYIARQTTWRIPASATVFPQLDIAFGEFFLVLKFRNQQIRFKLDELEKI